MEMERVLLMVQRLSDPAARRRLGQNGDMEIWGGSRLPTLLRYPVVASTFLRP